MAARKKTRRKVAPRKKARKSPAEAARAALDSNLRQLEKQLPKNLASGVRELRENLRDLEKQVDKARAEREERWQKLENQIRRDVARVLRRLEKAVAPAAKKPARKKPAAKKKAAGKKARKKAAPSRPDDGREGGAAPAAA